MNKCEKRAAKNASLGIKEYREKPVVKEIKL